VSEPRHAVIYAAKSTEDKHGSIPRQLADGRALAKGLTVAAEFSDEAASAYKGNRGPGLARAMGEAERLVREHGACALIVQHSDRLARGDGERAQHLVEYVLWARKAGVTLRSVQDPQTFDGMGLVYAALMGDRNHEDSARKGKSVSDGLKGRKERGDPIGPIPLGFTWQAVVGSKRGETERVVDLATKPTIERIWALLETGASYGDTARALNAEGFRTKRGKPWVARTVSDTVANTAYKGEKGYPALIEPERFDRLHAMLASQDPVRQQKRRGGRKPADVSYVLRGVAFCRSCGASMFTRRQAIGRAYVCRNRRQGTGLCSAPPVPAGLVESHVLRHLDVFVGSVEGWMGEQVEQRTVEHRAREAALNEERKALAALDRERELHVAEFRRQVAEGRSTAYIASEEVERIDRERDAQQQAITEAEAIIAEWSGPPDVDAALDYYGEIVDLVRGRIARAEGAEALNRALAQVLTGLWIGLDGDELHADFELRITDEARTSSNGLRTVLAREAARRRVRLGEPPGDSLPPFPLGGIPLTPELAAQLEQEDDPVAFLEELAAQRAELGEKGSCSSSR
jgi:DNA invertase Pin-like site-specific DNA recombinase